MRHGAHLPRCSTVPQHRCGLLPVLTAYLRPRSWRAAKPFFNIDWFAVKKAPGCPGPSGLRTRPGSPRGRAHRGLFPTPSPLTTLGPGPPPPHRPGSGPPRGEAALGGGPGSGPGSGAAAMGSGSSRRRGRGGGAPRGTAQAEAAAGPLPAAEERRAPGTALEAAPPGPAQPAAEVSAERVPAGGEAGGSSGPERGAASELSDRSATAVGSLLSQKRSGFPDVPLERAEMCLFLYFPAQK